MAVTVKGRAADPATATTQASMTTVMSGGEGGAGFAETFAVRIGGGGEQQEGERESGKEAHLRTISPSACESQLVRRRRSHVDLSRARDRAYAHPRC